MILAQAMEVLQAGVDPLTLAIGVGLSILAGLLLQKTLTNEVRDDAPTPLATRGAYAPYLRGRFRVGPIVALAGGRRTQDERVCGGKGDLFGTPKEPVFYEHGLHVLAVGPIRALHAIYEGGTKIFSGPITATSHPSGTTITTTAGSGRIYWGEQTQPIDSLLSTEVEIASRFPLFCYFVWNDKRLGRAPRWGALSYELEGRVQSTGLIDTPDYMAGTLVNEGAATTIVVGSDGAEGFGQFQVSGYHLDRIEIGEEFVVAGNTANGTYTVFFASYSSATNRTAVFPEGGLTGSDNNGTLQPTEFQNDDGVNLAHVIWEMLFAAQPYGLALDQSDWDIASLEALGTLMVTEDIKGNVVGENGETVEALLIAILQDLGVQIPVNYETGLIEFVPMREPVGMLPNLSSRLIDAPLPERRQFHGERSTDDIIFAFNDRLLNFRKNTIEIDDLGQARQLQHKRRREVSITSTVNFDTAALIGNRRELEEFTSKTKNTVHALRDARTLKPGDAITIDGFGDVMRVWGNKVSPATGKVELTVSPDFYGVALDTFTNSPPGVSSLVQPPTPDLAVNLLEIPAGLLPSLPDQSISVLRIRAHNAITSAAIYLSTDDTTFTFNQTEIRVQTGGTLDAELPATGLSRTSEITFTSLGPDIAQVLDLTADVSNWRSGRQLLVINNEICYARSITALGGGQYRANDVLRARYCTRKATHAVSTPLFIVANDGTTPVRDPLIQPDTTLYVKPVPRAGSSVALADVTSTSELLHGEGRKPRDAEKLQLTAPTTGQRNEYSTTDDITVSWRICLPITDFRGAGAIPAGNAVSKTPIQGQNFRLDWLTTGDVIQRTDNITAASDIEGIWSFTLTNAQLQSAFGGEPSSFRARITNTAAGLDSRNSQITINLV